MKVVTYRFDVFLGSLHMQQLQGFDELLHDGRLIMKRNLLRTFQSNQVRYGHQLYVEAVPM
jgi:hypothetical protein